MFSSVNNENRIFVTFELEDNRKSNIIVLNMCIRIIFDRKEKRIGRINIYCEIKISLLKNY